jgi:hypothetical protein
VTEKNTNVDKKKHQRNWKKYKGDFFHIMRDFKKYKGGFFIFKGGRGKFLDNHTLIFAYRNRFILFLIHSDSTFFDLAGTLPACLPDAAVLPTAGSGVTLIPALSVMAYGNIPEAVLAAVCRRHGSISVPFDCIGCNIIRQSHPL